MLKEIIEILKFIGTGTLGIFVFILSITIYTGLGEKYPSIWWAEVMRGVILGLYAFPVGRKVISWIKMIAILKRK